MDRMYTYIPALLCALFFLPGSMPAGNLFEVHYVRVTASGAGDGSSWTNAFTDLQDAIDVADAGDTIWVAVGTYFPTRLHNGDSLRYSTFYIDKDIAIYGGFKGDPGSEGDFASRDPQSHPTILSGDLGQPGISSDNAFHVVYIDHVSDSMRLDGFTIASGNSTGAGGFDALGAGIFNDADAGRSHPVIAHCVIRDNSAFESGGGMWNNAGFGGHANPTLISCSFIRNDGSGAGGLGGSTDEGGTLSPRLINCAFLGNTARTAQGGAIQAIAHSGITAPVLINCLVSGNFAPSSAAINIFVTGTGVATPEIINSTLAGNAVGTVRIVDLGLQTSGLKIRNSILFGNGGGHGLSANGASFDAAFSLMQFGFEGENIMIDDPAFVSQPPVLDTAHTLGDLHVLPGSPVIDAGRNTDVPAGISLDHDANPRFIDVATGMTGIVDLGAFEMQGSTTGVRDVRDPAGWYAFPNPADDRIEVMRTEAVDAGLLILTDVLGRIVLSEEVRTGEQVVSMDVRALPAGVYNLVLHVNHRAGAEKVIIY